MKSRKERKKLREKKSTKSKEERKQLRWVNVIYLFFDAMLSFFYFLKMSFYNEEIE